jgi:hypothetical protein
LTVDNQNSDFFLLHLNDFYDYRYFLYCHVKILTKIKNDDTEKELTVENYFKEGHRYTVRTVREIGTKKGCIKNYCCNPIQSVKSDENLWAINRKVCQSYQTSFKKIMIIFESSVLVHKFLWIWLF